MWFFNSKPRETLLEEHVQRTWDLASRITQLEDRLDAKLDELAKRYRRAETGERRLEEKRESPCDEPLEGETDSHPAIVALRMRQGKG